MRSIGESNLLTEEAVGKFLFEVCTRCLACCTGTDNSIDKDRATKLMAAFLRIINLYLQEEYLFNPTYVASGHIMKLTPAEESIRKDLLDIILSLHTVARGEAEGMEKMKAALVVNELAAVYADIFTKFKYPINKK